MLLQVACRQHSPDADVEHWFTSHRSDFEQLLALAQADPVVTIQPNLLLIQRGPGRIARFPIRKASELPRELPEQRWHRYRELLSLLHVRTLYKGERGMMFQMDAPGILNGDSQKGILYSLEALRSRSSLDNLTATDLMSTSCRGTKRIQDHWFVYLSFSCN